MLDNRCHLYVSSGGVSLFGYFLFLFPFISSLVSTVGKEHQNFFYVFIVLYIPHDCYGGDCTRDGVYVGSGPDPILDASEVAGEGSQLNYTRDSTVERKIHLFTGRGEKTEKENSLKETPGMVISFLNMRDG